MKISLQNKLETVLFLESEPVAIKDLAIRLKEKEKDCRRELEEINKRYDSDRSALNIVFFDNKVQLVIKKELATFVRDYFQKSINADQVSPAMLEVLSIILYKGPIGKAGIEQVRGVNCGLILKKLLIKGYVDREEQVENSRVFIYRPSFKLLKKLGISRLEELPDYVKLSGEIQS